MKLKLKHITMRQRLLIAGCGLSLLLLQVACASREPASQEVANQVQSIDYFLRWRHSDFEARYAWLNLLLPAAQAELPPEYQKAFSLQIQLQHSRQQLELDYHAQQVIDDSSHQYAHQQLGAQDYQALMQALAQPIGCETQVEPGWAGPAASFVRLKYPEREDWLYASDSDGSDGPGESLSLKGTRRYLCNSALSDLLTGWVQALKKPT